MHLALVPLVNRSANPLNPDWGPKVPASLYTDGVPCPHKWGQASDLWEPDGKMLIWTRASAAELLEIEAQKDSLVLDRACSDAEADAMVAGLGAVAPKWADRATNWQDQRTIRAKYRAGETISNGDRSTLLSLRDQYRVLSGLVHDHDDPAERDFVATYRAVAEPLERQRGAADLVAILVGMGMLAWQAAQLLTTLHQDNFTGSDGSIGTQGGPAGRTMSDGLGQWFVDRGNCNITSNVLRFNDNTNARAYDSAMSAVDEQEVFVTLTAAPSGPQSRRATSSTSYIGRWTGSVTQLREDPGGADGQIGSNGTNAATSDVMSIYSTGTSHTVRVNGSAVVGPSTDASKATGNAGTCGNGTSPNIDLGGVDDWRVDIASAGSGAPVKAYNYRRRRNG